MDIERIMAFVKLMTRRGVSLRRCISCTLALLLSGTAVMAAERPAGETVVNRSRPEVDPLGVTAGDFLILPRISLAGSYDDNVLATESNKKSDFGLFVSPEVESHSNWGKHALNLFASADLGRYADYSSEDFEDWEISADGRVDILHSSQLFIGAGGGRDHVYRTSSDDANGVKPTEFDHANAFGRYLQYLGRFSLQFDASVTRKDYDDVLGVNEVIINQDDRDRNTYRTGIRGGYEILPDSEVYLRLTGNRTDYDDVQDATNADSSSKGYEAVAGIVLDPGGVFFGDLYAGYMSQNYDSPYPDIDTPAFGTNLYWNPTGLTTFSLAVLRTINETISDDFSGYTSTNTSLVVDHELRRDLLLKAGIIYVVDDYAGIGSAKRDDSTYDLLLGSTYLVSRYLNFSVQYHHVHQDSDDNTASSTTPYEFDKNVILIQLNTQL